MLFAWQISIPNHGYSQDTPAGDAEVPPDDADGEVEVAQTVEVSPTASDGPIAARLYDIMFATGLVSEPQCRGRRRRCLS